MNLLIVRDRLPLGVWSERKGLPLDCSAGAKENRKEGGQSGPRYGRLGLIHEAYTVKSLSCSVDPSAWSWIVRAPSCQLALNMNFEDVTSLTNSSVTYSCQLAQARPHNVLHFLVIICLILLEPHIVHMGNAYLDRRVGRLDSGLLTVHFRGSVQQWCT